MKARFRKLQFFSAIVRKRRGQRIYFNISALDFNSGCLLHKRFATGPSKPVSQLLCKHPICNLREQIRKINKCVRHECHTELVRPLVVLNGTNNFQPRWLIVHPSDVCTSNKFLIYVFSEKNEPKLFQNFIYIFIKSFMIFWQELLDAAILFLAFG
jgi:hypothetical protein